MLFRSYDGQSYKSSSQVASTALSANTTYYALYNVRSNNTITYSVKAGKSVSFDRTDFRDVYENEFSSGSLRWVEFETDDTLSTSRGTVYYDYGGSDEEAFSRSSLEDERFYYFCDMAGLYVWCEMPSAYVSDERTVHALQSQAEEALIQYRGYHSVMEIGRAHV